MKRPHKGARRLIVDNVHYWYLIKGSAIIWDPTGKKMIFSLQEVTGRSHATIERGQWKKTSDGMITPGNVARFIRRLYAKTTFKPGVLVSFKSMIEHLPHGRIGYDDIAMFIGYAQIQGRSKGKQCKKTRAVMLSIDGKLWVENTRWFQTNASLY